ncbi:MAG: ABC transporter ATP-binding protein [Lachnospiraceae bacterium]|nr:ABC transporter ATP-binding protein [Lachnospiraceae bacterium]
MQANMDNILEIKDLEVQIISANGIVKAVRGANLSVRRGEIHGIVGESGCGKSVMMKSVMRLHDEDKVAYNGSIVLNDHPMLKLKNSQLNNVRGQEVAMIFQNPMTALSPIMKVGEQITEGLIYKQGMKKAEAKKLALEMLEKVGITPAESRYEQYPFELSGGLLQRIMIAMAMINHPQLLIADEPTTALDVTIQAQILHLMKSMQKSTGVSIILITHDLGVIAEVCDRVSVMYAGRIVESGSVYELFDYPGHPYTQALLHSMPKGKDAKTRLDTIPGAPPSLYENIEGCAFAPRCPYASERCRCEEPKKEQLMGAHYSVCHYAKELFEKGAIIHEG